MHCIEPIRHFNITSATIGDRAIAFRTTSSTGLVGDCTGSPGDLDPYCGNFDCVSRLPEALTEQVMFLFEVGCRKPTLNISVLMMICLWIAGVMLLVFSDEEIDEFHFRGSLRVVGRWHGYPMQRGAGRGKKLSAAIVNCFNWYKIIIFQWKISETDIHFDFHRIGFKGPYFLRKNILSGYMSHY